MGYLKVFYFQNLNFGDALNHFIFSTLSKKRIVLCNHIDQEPHILGIGSIANWATPFSTVWGSGLADSTNFINPDADIRLIRGPLSAEIATKSGNKSKPFYGDPALLLPKLLPSKRPTPKYKVGIIPHYVDQEFVYSQCNHDIKVIDVLQPILTTIDEILECETIVSSSLHGLIVSDAFGIPNIRVKMSDKINGDGIKFDDYFLSVDRKKGVPYNFSEICKMGKNEFECLFEPVKIKDLTNDILNSCPFEVKYVFPE